MPKLMSRYRKDSGFTLIELVMTIVVVGLIAVPLSISLTEQVQGAVASADYTAALNLGRFEMERVNNMAYSAISNASFSNYQGYAYDIERTVSYEAGGAASAESLKRVEVSVTKAGEAAVLLHLVTFFAANVSYGV